MSYLWFKYHVPSLPGGVCVDPSSPKLGNGPAVPFAFVFQLVYVTAVLALFSHFFVTSYVGGKEGAKKGPKTNKKAE
jgi:hypothetical protein